MEQFRGSYLLYLVLRYHEQYLQGYTPVLCLTAPDIFCSPLSARLQSSILWPLHSAAHLYRYPFRPWQHLLFLPSLFVILKVVPVLPELPMWRKPYFRQLLPAENQSHSHHSNTPAVRRSHTAESLPHACMLPQSFLCHLCQAPDWENRLQAPGTLPRYLHIHIPTLSPLFLLLYFFPHQLVRQLLYYIPFFLLLL